VHSFSFEKSGDEEIGDLLAEHHRQFKQWDRPLPELSTDMAAGYANGFRDPSQIANPCGRISSGVGRAEEYDSLC
jgi:hypothetical protein